MDGQIDNRLQRLRRVSETCGHDYVTQLYVLVFCRFVAVISVHIIVDEVARLISVDSCSAMHRSWNSSAMRFQEPRDVDAAANAAITSVQTSRQRLD